MIPREIVGLQKQEYSTARLVADSSRLGWTDRLSEEKAQPWLAGGRHDDPALSRVQSPVFQQTEPKLADVESYRIIVVADDDRRECYALAHVIRHVAQSARSQEHCSYACRIDSAGTVTPTDTHGMQSIAELMAYVGDFLLRWGWLEHGLAGKPPPPELDAVRLMRNRLCHGLTAASLEPEPHVRCRTLEGVEIRYTRTELEAAIRLLEKTGGTPGPF